MFENEAGQVLKVLRYVYWLANVDIAETKLDASFPSDQSTLEGYHTLYTLDINNKIGGLIEYIKFSLPSRYLFYEVMYFYTDCSFQD